MCVFTSYVSEVGDTRIFARAGPDGSQYLAYQMSYSADADLAMVLPLPTPPSPREDAVRFIDLSGYARFFSDAETGFEWMDARPGTGDMLGSHSGLRVHGVGNYEASFVPSKSDFSRLDPRFRLSDELLLQLPQYADWSFCVFKLRSGSLELHPIAFGFPRRDPGQLFFPTLHVHDGSLKSWAPYHHHLYCQADAAPEGWHRSLRLPEDWRLRPDRTRGTFAQDVEAYDRAVAAAPPLAAAAFMDAAAAQGLLEAERPLYRLALMDILANKDHFI
jgi:hypothetical protein